MISETQGLAEVLDSDLIGFLTAVNPKGQPQTSPIWFVRDGEDLIVYNRPDAARLKSIAENERVAFNLRADRVGGAGVTLEGTASIVDIGGAREFPGYVEKYGREIERLGWTPDSFDTDYPVAIRIRVTRVRVWGLEKLS